MKMIQPKGEQEHQRQKRELNTQLRILIDEMKGRPALTRSTAGFPYNLVEDSVSFVILFLESFIAALVSIALVALRKPRVR